MADHAASIDFQAVILAAGRGTRMRSQHIKVLHPILGLPMLAHPMRAAREAGARLIVPVLGHDKQKVEAWLESFDAGVPVRVATQAQQLGTGHAVFCALEQLDTQTDYTVILSGDVPNLRASSLRAFVASMVQSGAPLGVMTAHVEQPGKYGRIVRNSQGDVTGIVEFADASEQQRAIKEINAGIYVARTDFLMSSLQTIMDAGAHNAQQEYYLTDLVALASDHGAAMGWALEDLDEAQGVNTRAHLAMATRAAQQRVNNHWMAQGVTMISPSQTFIDVRATLEQDVVLYPNVHIEGASHISQDVVVEQGTLVRDSHIGPGTTLKAHSYLHDAKVGAGANIGPFAHLRPGSDVGDKCKVGNFVEIKKTVMHEGSKAGHLTYLGDAQVGAGANIGAGTITCNYDGTHKHQTVIGQGAFIGSNSALVAPVSIGDSAYVAAGSTITNEVPDDALGVARSRQRNIERWAERREKSKS